MLKPKIFWGLFIILLTAALIIEFGFPQWIAYQYQHNQFDLLNTWTHSDVQQPLTFYIGYMEEFFFGPLNMVLGGLAFCLFGWRYLRDVNGRTFAFAVFLFLCITKFEILTFPPYGDALSGPLAEAMWLYKHSFNYKLLAEQATYLAGGPKVYFFTIYPGFIALLLTLIPNVKAFLIINHLIVFLFGAIAMACLRAVLLNVYDKSQAFLATVLCLSMPLFQAQVEQINMELMLLFFSMLAMYFSVQKKFIWAGLMAACAAMAKGTGILICGAVILICVFLFFWGKEYRFKPRVLWGAVVAFSFLIGKYYSTFHILHHGTEKASYLVGFFLGWKENKCLPVLYLCGASFLLFAGVYLKEQFRKQTKNLAEYVHKNYTVFVGMVFMLAWWGLFIHSYAAIYRYRLLLVPFSLFCVFYMVQYLVRNKNIITGLLGAAVVFSFWGSYGYLYKKEDVIIQYVGERSLEYRIDLKLQMEIARKIEREFSNYTVGAPFVMAQALAFPEYGYVSKKMDVMMYDFPAGYGGIREYKPLQKDELLRTIWIGFKTHIPYEEKKVIEYYPYGPGDQMIEEWMWGMKKGVLFRGGQYIERKYLLRQLKIREYLKHHGHRE